MDTISVRKKKNSYTPVDNEILKRSDMSMKAKGLLCYLLSLPEDWKIFKTELKNHFTDGKDSVNSAFNELMDLGYIEAVESERSEGKFTGNHYTVADYPLRVNRCGETAAGNPPLLNTNKVNNNKQNLNINDDDKKSPSCYKEIIEFWLKEFHEGWAFTAVHGKQVKELITKITTSLKTSNKDYDEGTIVESFKAICRNLPEYYKNKDLQILNSKYNEIIEEIKSTRSGRKPATGFRQPSKYRAV